MTQEHYDAEYYEKLYGKDGLEKYSSHWWAVRYYALVADRWLRRTGGTRVLEIGCGHGFVLARLAPRYKTFGIDLSEYATQQCARFAPGSVCHQGDIEVGMPPQFAGMEFDMVIAKYVFEHLRDPVASFGRVRDALRPGGLLFFSVPNLACPGNRLRGPDWYARLDPTHVSLWEPEVWEQRLEASGYRIRSAFSDGFWDLPYFKSLPKFLQLPLLLPTAAACLTGWELVPKRWGENLMIVAEKV